MQCEPKTIRFIYICINFLLLISLLAMSVKKFKHIYEIILNLEEKYRRAKINLTDCLLRKSIRFIQKFLLSFMKLVLSNFIINCLNKTFLYQLNSIYCNCYSNLKFYMNLTLICFFISIHLHIDLHSSICAFHNCKAFYVSSYLYEHHLHNKSVFLYSILLKLKTNNRFHIVLIF